MTTSIDYLKKCITSGKIIENRNWYITCFGIPLLKEDNQWENKTHLEIVTKLDGLYYVEEVTQEDQLNTKQLVKIVDYKKDTPLFNFQDTIEVDSSWLPTIKGKLTTKIGNLIINAIVLYPSLGNKVEYINSSMKPSTIETIFTDRVRNDDVATENDILVREMIDCLDRLNFLTNLSTLISIAATPKSISRPPNLDEEKSKLLKEYEGQLHDPVKLVELESKLAKIDNEFLADDPAAKNIFNKKSRTARKKMLLIYGETQDFITKKNQDVIIPSLSEGVDTSEENFPAYMNDLRSGSFSRGSSTALSGYSYKVLQRSLSGVSISKTPCNTTKGIVRLIDNSNYKKLVSRYIKDKGWKLIKDITEAKNYIGKNVEIRSSMYCTSPGNTVCYACMSENYKDTPSGITNIAANISSVLMNLFLKKMHGSITEVVDIEMKDLCS